jgi:citrate synthase
MSTADEPIMTITTAHLNTGLRGYPVGTCRTSRVSPDEGVSYVGYPIADLAFMDPEAVVFLLHNKHLPSADELAAFKADLASRAKVPQAVLDLIQALPHDGHPMEWLCTGLLALGMTGKTDDYREDALNLVARTSEVVAAIFRRHQGWGDLIPSKPELGLVENFVHMLGVPGADPERLARLLRAFYVLHMDHGGGNLSTFAGKAVASGLADMYASMTAAMAGLYGPRHGRANQSGLNFVRKCGSSDPADVEAFIRGALAKKELIYGYGHAVLRAEDPRATIQYALGEDLYPEDPLFRTAVTMRDVAVRVLKENPKISNPYPNVDAVSGALLHASGITNSDFYTVLFGWSRIVGISAQIVDERLHLRDGKGVPIYRCKFIAEQQDRT